MGILILILFCVWNSRLAKKKGLKPQPWVWRTIGGVLLGTFLGAPLVVKDYHGPQTVAGIQQVLQSPLKIITFLAFEAAGALLVRYFLDKKPAINNTDN